MQKCRTLLLLLLLLIESFGFAKSLISSNNCIIGTQAASSNIITVRPIPKACYTRCNQYCLEKFKLSSDDQNNNSMSQNKDEIIFRSNVFNVNKDRLQACVNSCYRGEKFDTKIRVPLKLDPNSGKSVDDDGILPYQWKCDIMSKARNLDGLSCNYPDDDFPADINATCDNSELEEASYSSQITFKAGNKISVNLSNIVEKNSDSNIDNNIIKSEENNIYLCGFKTVFFSPEYFIKDKSYKGDSPTSTIFSPRADSGVSSLKNGTAINTGIKVKDGDYIRMQYIGRYNSNCQGGNCQKNDNDYKIDIFVGAQKIDFEVSPYQMNDYDDSNKEKQADICNICSNDDSSQICKTPQCGYYKDKPANKYGLSVNTFWLSSPELFKNQPTNNLLEFYSKFRSTILSGKITNVGNNPQELFIQYPDSYSNLNDRYGGYFVSIEWRGCNYKNGERLQYAIVNEALYNSFKFDEYMTKGVKWTDLKMTTLDNDIYSIVSVNSDELKIPSGGDFGFDSDGAVTGALPQREDDYKGRIFFKIKTLDGGEINTLTDEDISRANTTGQYNLKVINLSSDKGLLTNLVNDFITDLKNIPKNIFNGFVNNSQYVIIIRLLLVLYIAFTGFLFVAGMAQITQQEAAIRVFRIAVVLMLLSENSFDFFNNYLFNAFSFDSMNWLANTVTPNIQMDIAPGLNSGSDDCFAVGVEVKMLCVLEKDMKLFFKWDFWNRVIGLAFSGFFVGALAITIGIIMYATVIFKITALYCISLLAMTITLSLAPIFLPLLLFKYTKTFFDAWIKQLISLLLQPVFIFIAISLFRVLFIVLVKSLMGTGSCKICWIEFFTWCWVEVYVPLSLGSSPSFASMPMSNLGVLLALYFVGHGMYSFCTEVTRMGNRMISFSLFSVGSAKVGVKDIYGDAKKFGSMTYNIATAPLDALSIDDKSMDDRKKMRKQRRDNQNSE